MGSKNLLKASTNDMRHCMGRILLPLLLLIFIIILLSISYHNVNQELLSVSMSPNNTKRTALAENALAGNCIHRAFTSCNTKLMHCQSYNNIDEFHKQNRCVMNTIDVADLLPSKTESFYNVLRYGLPDHAEYLLMKDVGEPINLSDLIPYILTLLGPNSNYLEIGVSICKTLFQVLTINCQANIVAFDIEKINPRFEKLMKPVLVQSSVEEIIVGHEYTTPGYSSPKKDHCTLNKYNDEILRDNNFYYLNCDELDQVGWNRMEQLVSTLPTKSFQVIFSDALHTVEAISFELDHVFQHNLLNKDHFAYVWNDMGEDVSSFCERLVNYASPDLRKNITCVVGKLPGSFGINAFEHRIAIMTTLDIRDIISKHVRNALFIRDPYSL